MIPYRGARRWLFELYFASMPIHAWKIRGRHVRREYSRLKDSEFFSSEEMSQLRLERLREILKYAQEESDFYRSRFKSVGFDPCDVKSLDDLRKIPLLEKADVRENLIGGLTTKLGNSKNSLRITTSGSTGQPFTIYADRHQLEVRFAATLRAMEWTGWQFGDPQARLWHQTIGMSRTQVLRERLDALLLRRHFIPAFEITPENIERFIGEIRQHDPVLVDGYAESLNFLAGYISAGNVAGFSPRAVISSAQALPDSTRATIETGLDTRVFDKYGSREFSGIAYECSAHSGHHVVDETYIVELLVDGRPAQPGEIGEIVITDLLNRATPMIRYRIGDLAVALEESQCKCGRAHSRIGEIQGRTQAIVHCANGRWIPGTFFAHFFKDHEEHIRFFQVKQDVVGAFDLLIVPSEVKNEHAISDIVDELRTFVGDTDIRIKYVDTIPLVRTGKRSTVVSSVSADFQSLTKQTRDEVGE